MIASPPAPSLSLIRRLGGIEWPAAGSWRIAPTQTIEVRRTWGLLARRADVHVGGGALSIGPDGLGSQLTLHLAAAPPGPPSSDVVVEAEITAVDVAGDWSVIGRARRGETSDPRTVPLTGTVRYLGVFRTPWRAAAALAVDLHTHRRRGVAAPRLQITGHLEALAPTDDGPAGVAQPSSSVE